MEFKPVSLDKIYKPILDAKELVGIHNEIYALIKHKDQDYQLIWSLYHKEGDYLEVCFENAYLGTTEFHLSRKPWHTDKKWNENQEAWKIIEALYEQDKFGNVSVMQKREV